MSVLIHGMEMPQSCDDCRLNNGISCYAVPEYTEDGVVGRTEDRPDWCPLVPVPPHGRWNNIIQGIIPSGQCSNCGAWDKVTRFCPNCGSRMEDE